jgi:hypothetical protein
MRGRGGDEEGKKKKSGSEKSGEGFLYSRIIFDQ